MFMSICVAGFMVFLGLLRIAQSIDGLSHDILSAGYAISSSIDKNNVKGKIA